MNVFLHLSPVTGVTRRSGSGLTRLQTCPTALGGPLLTLGEHPRGFAPGNGVTRIPYPEGGLLLRSSCLRSLVGLLPRLPSEGSSRSRPRPRPSRGPPVRGRRPFTEGSESEDSSSRSRTMSQTPVHNGKSFLLRLPFWSRTRKRELFVKMSYRNLSQVHKPICDAGRDTPK